MEKDKIIVIPTYNESDTIESLISEVLKIQPDADILIVDDNSPDGTGRLIDRLSGRDSRVRCLHRLLKEGIGPAYIEGFKKAMSEGYRYILQMDADFSHNPKYIQELFSLAKTYDVVIGSRYTKGGGIENWGIIRRLISRFGSVYAKLVLGIPVSDLTGGFKCFKRQVLEQIGLDDIASKGYAFQIEMTFRAHRKGFRVKEFPIIFSDRRAGQTKMSGAIFLEAAINVWKFK